MTLSWGTPEWLWPAAGLAALALVVVVIAYRRSPASATVRVVASALKIVAIAALVLCLLEPLFHSSRARPGANLFVVLVDGSGSMATVDGGESRSRGETLRDQLAASAPWLERLTKDFDVRRYVFDALLRSVDGFEDLRFDGEGSALGAALDAIARRYRDRPLAGVLLLSDGNATDSAGLVEPGGAGGGAAETARPPLYAVPIGGDGPDRYLAVRRVTVSQTQFETAPVTVRAEIVSRGVDGEMVRTTLRDEEGREVARDVRAPGARQRFEVPFELRPETPGLSFYRVEVGPDPSGDEPTDEPAEAPPAEEPPTEEERVEEARRGRWLAVDRPRGPYRVLYVSGRPNWEFKFLRRALSEDEEVELIGLVRIARREPKFEFRSRRGESTNPLFRGFGADEEDAERYDQPVLMRLGTDSPEELRDGFPKAAEELFRYDAVILDDVEAEFFSAEQMALLREFVSRRGGGLLMLGGQESFGKGGYRTTPVGELLPVYLDPPSEEPPPDGRYRWTLTVEGRFQPWVRLRQTEDGENLRLESMPEFRTLQAGRGIKPGALVLARAEARDGSSWPALVAQRFGRGRTAALLLGDLWRWPLRRERPEDDDSARAWRQTVRWLLAEVPRRLEASASTVAGRFGSRVRLSATVRDPEYRPVENASVTIEVTTADGETRELSAEASAGESGRYATEFVPRESGVYRARVRVTGPDGEEIGEDVVGWTHEPLALELGDPAADRDRLARLAAASGGEVVEPERLERFAARLPERPAPIRDPWVMPLWHQWSVFVFALACLCGEWALRRWRGLP